MKTYAALLVTSALLSASFTYVLLSLCRALKWFDQPDYRRKIHTQPIPRLGGVAIFLTFNLSLGLLLLRTNLVTEVFRLHLHDVTYILIPGTFVFLAGLYDDVKGLSARCKFGLQILAALFLYYSGFRISQISNPFGSPIEFGMLALPITVFWVVGITNAFNLIDGMDGLAAGIAFFVSLSVFAVSVLQNHVLISIFSVIMAGATLGFLRYNFNPARVFMGDSGSYFLGFVLSAITIQGSQKSPTMVSLAVPILLLGIPITETLLTITRRFLDGRPIFTADQEHMHHMLYRLVRSQRFAVLILYGITALFGLASFLVVASGDTVVALVSIGTGLIALWGLRKLGYVELEELWDFASRLVRFERRIIANQIFIRKASNALERADSLDGVLAILAETFGALNFDYAEIAVSRRDSPEGPPYMWRWKQPARLAVPRNGEAMDHIWKILIPIHDETNLIGVLTLARSLDKEGLPFQVSSIVNLFTMKLNNKLSLFPANAYPDPLALTVSCEAHVPA